MIMKNVAAIAALFVLMAIPASAQQPGGPGRGVRGGAFGGPDGMQPRMLNVELALRLKDRLKLTDSQANQLEALRKEIVADRQANARDMIDVQSRVAAGLIKREDVRKQFEDKGDALRKTMEDRQARISKILTPEQQDTLQRATRRMMMQRMRAGRGQMGPGQMGPGMMGPGMRRRGMMRPGMMGPGMMGPGIRRFMPGDRF